MIRIEALDLWLGKRQLLRSLSLHIETGSTLALLGPSGSGKTTLARLLTGLIVPVVHDCAQGALQIGRHGAAACKARGLVEIAGVDLLTASPRKRQALPGRRVGLIAQALADALNPHMTVIEHVEEMIRTHGVRGQTAREACLRFNLPERLHQRLPNHLSGGEIQRVLTALAMVCEPDHLILDEPTAALDRDNRDIAATAFRRGAETRAQLLITHDLELARSLADSVAVLAAGQLVDVGPASAVLDRLHRPASVVRLQGRNVAVEAKTAACSSPEPASQTQAARLVVADLRYRIGHRPLLDGLTFSVEQGCCVAIMGASGSGKSTLARQLTGFTPLDTGQISWQTTENALALGDVQLRSALISQHPHRALARHFTVAQVLQEVQALTTASRRSWWPMLWQRQADRIAALLERVGLPGDAEFLQRRTSNLSGGEAQRLVIARAIATSPLVIVADEPTAALDRQTRDHIIALFRQLMEEQAIALVLLTHDLEVASALAEESYTLGDGRLLPFRYGEPAQIGLPAWVKC